MQSIKDIKKRIKSVSETAQITKAMELISAAKMQKALAKYRNSLAFFDALRPVLLSVAAKVETDEPHPYLTERQGRRAYLVFGSDRGMSGDYNHALSSYALSVTKEDDVLFCVGNAVVNMLSSQRSVVPASCSSEGTMEDARLLTNLVMKRYGEDYTELNVLYTTMRNKAQQECRTLRLLPVDLREETQKTPPFEVEGIDMADLAWQYVIATVYHCLTAARYTEHMERRRAMNAATENANELLEELQLRYNKARQEKITTELTELSGGLIDN